MQQLDITRLELQIASQGFPRPNAGIISDHELEERVLSENQDLEDSSARISALRTQHRQIDEDLDSRLREICDLEIQISNASFRPDTPQFSLLFWRGIRVLRASIDLVDADKAEVSHATSMYELANSAMAEAIALAQGETKKLEANPGLSSEGLRNILIRLHHAISLYHWHRSRLEELEVSAKHSQQLQRANVDKVLLNRAGPTLEAETVISRDRLRYSVLEEHRPGEPLIISDDPKDKLTQNQYDELIEDFNEAVVETNRRREVVRRLDDNYA